MGGVVAYRLRSDLRRRWRAVFGLALLVAVLGGIVLATAAGARRTSSAYDRLLGVVNPPELLVSPPNEAGSDATPLYDAVAREPGVRGMRMFAGVPLVAEAGTPSASLAEALGGIGVLALIDGLGGSGVRPTHEDAVKVWTSVVVDMPKRAESQFVGSACGSSPHAGNVDAAHRTPR